MRIVVKGLLALALLLSMDPAASAWGPAGHKIIASIAFRQLTPVQQKKILDILKPHPRFREDFTDKMPDGVEQNEWLFQQAAAWPDLARGLPSDAKREFSRPNWHFIDLPFYPTSEDAESLQGGFSLNVSFDMPQDADENMNLVQAMKFAQKVLADRQATDADKAKYLCWIFHLAGDAHQPLHATTLCVTGLFPEGDRGGNWIPTKQGRELHALWDGFPGSPRMNFQPLKNKAATLLANRSLRSAGESAANDLNVETWVKESHALAETAAYAQEVLDHLDGHTDRNDLPPLELSNDYLQQGGAVTQKRLVEAGYRLGGILKTIADR